MTTIPIRPIIIRILMLAVLAAGFISLGFIAVRNAIGDSIMTFVQRNTRLSVHGKVQGADLAVRFSPKDPLIHWLRGGIYFNAANEELSDEWLKTSLEELELATRMSPEDYRIWLAYGRVLDRDGATDKAGVALNRALSLAPNHFDTHWALGNHYLRAGEREKSFIHMRQALTNRPSALPLVFDYAWSEFHGDGKAIAEALDPPVEIRSQMISMLIYRDRVEDGLSVWGQLNQPTFKDVQRVTESLINVGQFGKAFEIWKAANIPERPAPDADSILSNGSFENSFSFNSKTPFYSWRITPTSGVRVTFDLDRPQSGRQSLRYSFTVDGNNPITLATQTVPISQDRKYCLSFQVRSEDLKSLSMPYVEIYDSADVGRAHTATEPFPIDQERWDAFETKANGKAGPNSNKEESPWRSYSLSITTKPETEAVTIRIQRQACPDPYCSLEGRIWFDNFKLIECR